MLSFADGPSQDVSALLQSSCVDPDTWDATVGVAVEIASDVGDVIGVNVAGGVGEAVSVGGASVAVGMAASV